MIFQPAAENPDGLALDDLVRRRTWRELSERTARAARLLRGDLGLAPGDHAAVLMENRVEVVELTLAALFSGIWLTPIQRHLHPEEIRYIVSDSGARVLFTDDEHAETARACDARDVVVAGPDLDGRLSNASADPVDPENEAGGNMIYTSGTTGRPKGVKRARAASVGAAVEAARSYARAIGLDGSGPHLVSGPLYHAAPLMFAIYDLLCGAPMVIAPRFDAAQTLALLREREIRHTHLVPTMCVRLLRLPLASRAAFRAPRLSLVLHGAAPIAPDVKRAMIEWWGEILVEYWGGTEGGVATLVDSRDWLARPGTVGRAVRSYEVFAVDDEGSRLPAGETGMLYSRHTGVSRVFEYHGDPEKTEAAHLSSGAFTLGDIGWVDEEGWVYLQDRRANTIISGGVNIYPAEIEAVVQVHPAVADVAVFGVPDDEWGESVKAAVELERGHTPSAELTREILDFARSRLAGYKVPRSIDFEEELPRYETGKLHVRQLRDRYWKGRERRI